LLRGAQIACAVQKERFTRRKHHWGGLGDVANFYAKLRCVDGPIDLVVECYSSDSQFQQLSQHHKELSQSIQFTDTVRIERISHHVAHLYSVFHPSAFESAAVMILDSMGSPVGHLPDNERAVVGNAPTNHVEVATFYDARQGSYECVGKQLWDLDRSNMVGVGNFYYLLTQTIFPRGAGNEGKVMGLAPYGLSAALGLPPLRVEECNVYIPSQWREALADRDRFGYFTQGRGTFEDCANLAAAGQRAFEEALLKLTRWLYEKTHAPALCFAGGTALNCAANMRITREGPFKHVFVPPAPHDGGTALGCAMYGMIELLGHQEPRFRWRSDYLGPDRSTHELCELARSNPELTIVEDAGAAAQRTAALLAEGNVVALYQSRSEFGPRALGHRSILADPRRLEMRDWINKSVKGREMFRPLAPAVLLEDAPTFFELEHESPFMTLATPTRPTKAHEIPAVVHVDGTARVQTVGENDDPFFRQVLREFRKLTGIGVVLNTSFNGQNEPIVESEAEALHAFLRFPIYALVAPPYVITKRNPPPALKWAPS
jgi:carbamoyltransferase